MLVSRDITSLSMAPGCYPLISLRDVVNQDGLFDYPTLVWLSKLIKGLSRDETNTKPRENYNECSRH